MESSPVASSFTRPLRLASAAIAAVAAVAVATGIGSLRPTFRPSAHGFKFVNRFEGSPLPFSLGEAEKGLGLPSHFGLCGGMSSAAADFYLAERPVPSTGIAPAQGTPLYNYLYKRQVASLGALGTYATKFVSWMALPDGTADGTNALTWDTLAEVRRRFEPAAPARPGQRAEVKPVNPVVVLGLVLVSFRQTRELWQNHQVLVYGVREAPPANGQPRGVDLLIYDPNYPGADGAVIRCRPRVVGMLAPAGPWPAPTPVVGIASVRVVPGKKDTPVRGFFPMPYNREFPLAGL
jgi:hypothetical protein